MAETQPGRQLVRFGAFEADLRTGELRKDGVKLKFGGQPFQVLIILLEHPGEVVTREELQKRLWPDTFVDVERNLNTAINKIREVLGDSTETPRFIETLPRRGYRFIGQVESPPQTADSIEHGREWHSRQIWLKIAASVVAIAILSLGVFVVSRWPKRVVQSESEVLTPHPFTAYPGQEIAPAISPDGSRIAFAWNKDAGTIENGFDLYVKAIGSETLLRLTHHPSNWISSAWSPDGTQIAFHRLDGDQTGVYVVPALGGPERMLVSTRIRTIALLGISWSPDERWIAYGDYAAGKGDLEHVATVLLSTDTLENKLLPNPPNCVNTGTPTFSHNGEFLAYWCLRSMNEFGLYSMPFPNGQGRLILTMRGFPSGLSWSADDTRLIYANELGLRSELGEVNVASGMLKRLEIAGDPLFPTVSSKGDKLAYSFFSTSIAIWRRDLLHPEFPPVELVPSTRSQYDAQYSPDRKQIAFASERSGVQGVWVSGEDGSNLVQISEPNIRSGSPQWSPDGKRIAFDAQYSGRWEIYVADVAKGIPQKLTTNISDFARPHWSRDGRWIYFMSNELGRMGAYRCPAQGGNAVALSKDLIGMAPQESFYDGAIYYASGSNKPVLKRVDQATLPGTSSEIDGLPRLLSEANWTPTADGIYFVPANSPRSLRHFDFGTKRIRSVFEAEEDFASGMSVSSDGRWILYSQAGNVNSDIMLVDHFH
jgi:Tol biopolymer transport system component/DNA-binding winged helix-turn-helix (wHTH) protein